MRAIMFHHTTKNHHIVMVFHECLTSGAPVHLPSESVSGFVGTRTFAIAIARVTVPEEMVITHPGFAAPPLVGLSCLDWNGSGNDSGHPQAARLMAGEMAGWTRLELATSGVTGRKRPFWPRSAPET